MAIQKKSLQHVSKILRSVDSYPIYRALSEAMKEAEIDNGIMLGILNVYQEAMSNELNKITDSKDWIDTLISDIK